MHSSLRVANKILDLVSGGVAGGAVTPMQLIKLVYMCHGWMLGLYSRPLIKEEVEAWQYGPVVPNLYHQVKRYRSAPIDAAIEVKEDGEFDEYECSIIDQVTKIYGQYDGIELSRMTHAPGTPWHIAWTEGGPNTAISNDLIENHYKQLAA